MMDMIILSNFGKMGNYLNFNPSMKIVNFIEVINDSCLLEMLLVEGGEFMMGDDEEDEIWNTNRLNILFKYLAFT